MQNVESAMEKGEAGHGGLFGDPAPSASPTSPTLYNSSTKESTDFSPAVINTVATAQVSRWSRLSWKNRGKPTKKYRVPVRIRRLNDHARGYPNLAAFLDSDEGFSIYRRFGYLQARLLLDKQEELRLLEEKLQTLDLAIAEVDGGALCSRTLYGPNADEHRKILTEIETVYCSYANILQTAQQMRAFNTPSNSEYESVGRYIDNRKPLDGDQSTWIEHKEDIITIRPTREHAWLDEVLEGFLKVCHCKIIEKIFRSKVTRKKTEIDCDDMPGQPPKNEDEYELYYTPSRISTLAHGILTLLILTLLIVPIYILYNMIHNDGTHRAYMICIGTLLVFTLAFSAVLSVFTKAKRHEALAAAAAYCAVLVVFLGNVSPPGK